MTKTIKFSIRRRHFVARTALVGFGAMLMGLFDRFIPVSSAAPITNAGATADASIISLEEEHNYLVKLGSRPTGSPAHKALIEHVAKRFSELGMTVQRDTHEFTRWHVPDKNRLQLRIGNDSLRIASAFPYSGATGPKGIQGNLVLVQGNESKHWNKAKGAIAVIEVHHKSVPLDLLLSTWGEQKLEGSISNPLVSAMLFGPSLEEAKKAGVLGVIAIWRGISERNAEGQYVPFTLPYQNIPGLWVAGESGDRVLAAARENRTATFILDAVLEPNCKTDTIWAISPGKHPGETIIVNTHSDGLNVVEENGHLGMLALAEQAMKTAHARTMIFAFITGHMRIPAVTQHGQATTAWLEKHPEYWKGGEYGAKAVGGLAIEHLGAREFSDKPSGQYRATGKPEMEILYATTPELNRLVNQSWRGSNHSAKDAHKPSPLYHFGEGEPLYARKIPAIALVTGPQYLLAEVEDDLVDMQLLKRQVASFSRLLAAYDKMPAAGFGEVEFPSIFTKLGTALKSYIAVRSLKSENP